MKNPLRHQDIPPNLNKTTGMIVECAYQVHKRLGPGLMENIYELCLAEEFERNGLKYQRQVELPVKYRDKTLDHALRLDLVVENEVIVEIKATERLTILYEAQLMTYLKLSGRSVGLLVNFNVPMIRQGIRRMVLTRNDECRILEHQ